MSKKPGPLKIGLLGCGTIGSGVYHLIQKDRQGLEEAAGRPLEVARILVKDKNEDRPFPADESLMVTDEREILDDGSIEVYIEVLGGLETPRRLALEILKSGRHLVSANKELVARYGRELMEAAAATDSHVHFEASVGGGIPLLRPLQESLGGDRIVEILGIVNGTTNYILSRMSVEGSTYPEALEDAKELGYAEADPSADVGGGDAASKLAILCSIAFKVGVTDDQIYTEGIGQIRPEDIENAAELGYSVKLLAIAHQEDDGISARVHPTMIPVEHPLASISGNFNAIFVVGESAGELMFYGQGAGSLPTATAILGDVVNIARNIGRPPYSRRSYWSRPGNIKPMEDVTSRYYQVLKVVDRPGVLAKIAGVFGENKVSLERVVQKGIGDQAEIVLITHEVEEKSFQAARRGLEKLEVVLEIPSVIRVESG